MKTKDEVMQSAADLDATIQEARKRRLTDAQDLALNFALRLTSTSRIVVLLTSSGAALEAYTICRLLFEHFFNVNALLHKEEHRSLLLEHSLGEPGRQLKKIFHENEKFATVTPENLQRMTEFLNHPDRESDPKIGLNWEQISRLGDTAGLYTTYKTYSFLYAHSTLASLSIKVSDKDVAQLHENVWFVLELARSQLRMRLLTGTSIPLPNSMT